MKVVAVHCFACCLSFVFVLIFLLGVCCLLGLVLGWKSGWQSRFGGRMKYARKNHLAGDVLLNFQLLADAGCRMRVHSKVHRNSYEFLHTDSDT